ncbi:Signal transduction histidine kinase [Saccharopolyspora kobensis]|uniref:histidine kinase n=1 Tax=Saccharopolyspora kobensis TaxID=146035 RepID=A0A1H6EEJ4_9PSEU|nr:histidine kinase [Saccharopolyspora kobensis]SEG96202.1 Signal transduction histidine kinase [Saccharopolyspora kobensis]SFD21435.1 Signal transduction histidine kinase [Saccharopolyspora kobensis]
MSSFATPNGTGPDAPWWHRFGSLLREQWIFAALLGLVLCGDALALISIGGYQRGGPLLIPGITAMALLAVLGRRRPVRCGLLAALALIGNTGVLVLTRSEVYHLGLAEILPTENAAGLLLVLYLFRASSLRKAIPVTAVLVLACLASVVVRMKVATYSDGDLESTLSFGVLQLLLATGTGLYLRGNWPGRSRFQDSPMQGLLRRQWPVMAALSILLFLEFSKNDNLSFLSGLVVLLSGLVMAVLATFAPMRPTESAYLGAATMLLTTLVMQVLGLTGSRGNILGPVSLAATGAGMLLVTYVVRHAETRRAIQATATLVVVTLLSVFMTPRYRNDLYEYDPGNTSELMPAVFMGGLLLVISVGTGMYFRARDEERARTVHSAVESAQQAERMALARELHDVVAHHVTGIVVQAQAAQMVAEMNPKAATDALARIAESGTEALTAMRRLVGSMRSTEPAGASTATEQATTDLEADLRALVESAQRQPTEHTRPPRVDLRVDLVHRPVPQEVARSALRVVQESLTNSEKHALDASLIQVKVWADHENLYTLITDDGSGVRRQPVGGSGGYGLVGMRERIELLGGTFHAGPGEHVGWRVEAELPLEDQSGDEGQR